MRYPAFFISTTDATIRFRQPCRVNVSIRPQGFKVELFKAIPIEQITAMTVEHEVSDKELSASKAIAGAVLAGGIGALAGAAMGGKKVSSVLTVGYTNERKEACVIVLDVKLASLIKEKYDKYHAQARATHHTVNSLSQPQIKPASSHVRRGLIIYFTWPFHLLKKLTNK